MVYEWKDKSVLVTGGANGIGSELVKKLVEEEAKYVALLDIDEAQALALQKELNKKHGKHVVHFHKCDISVEDQIRAVFDSVVKESGYIDVVVNNAAICNDSLNMLRKEIEINFTGLVTISLKALALMRKDEGGRGGAIINVSSIAALMPLTHITVYAACKSAVLQFSQSIGSEYHYKKTRVRVITVCFGVTNTGIFDRSNLSFCDKAAKAHLKEVMVAYPKQTPEAAALGLLEAYKKGDSASTWLVNDGKAKDITDSVRQAYTILAAAI